MPVGGLGVFKSEHWDVRHEPDNSALVAHGDCRVTRGWAVDDAARLATLAAFDLAEPSAEAAYDAIAAQAAALCETPVALVTVLGEDHQWFKAKVGTDFEGTPVAIAICRHTLEHGDALVIPDLATDPRTEDNPLVTDDPKVRFYAGIPLAVDGQALGTLCVLDLAPRPHGLTPEQQVGLATLADDVVQLIEQRRR